MAEKQLVPLEEVIGQFGGSAELLAGWMDREGVEVATDWAGRAALQVEVAAKLVTSFRTEQESHARKWSSYQAYLDQRLRDRHAAGEKAYADVADRRLRAEMRGGIPGAIPGAITLSPAGREVARQARLEAFEAFDRKHSPVPFDKFKG